MEIPVYSNLKEFKENYEIDFLSQTTYNQLQYLRECKKIYSEAEEEKMKFWRTQYKVYQIGINRKNEPTIIFDADENLTMDIIAEELEIFSKIKDNFEKAQFFINHGVKELTEIIGFINSEIEREKLNTYKLHREQESPSELLTVKQTQKIALLIQSGIVDFLRSKYPYITNNQIAGFFELITQEPLKQKSANTHFTKDKNNSKYPIQNKQTEIALDLILSKFGMKTPK